MHKNLFAYTAPGADRPPYISINKCDGGVTITVRSEEKYDGQTGVILLTDEQFEQMKEALR